MNDQKVLTGLKKASSHLRKVVEMVENDKYCIDVIQQNLAVIGLLRSANIKILERHLNSCFVTAMEGTNEKKKQEMIDEILKIEKIR